MQWYISTLYAAMARKPFKPGKADRATIESIKNPGLLVYNYTGHSY